MVLKIKLTILVITIVSLKGLFAQMTIQISSVPFYYTPLLDTIFVSGTFNDWNADSTDFIMNEDSNGIYVISIYGTDGEPIEFKFTRGDWSSVETQQGGAFLPNRSAIYHDGDTLYCDIADWEDFAAPHTAVGNTHIIDTDFYIPQLERYRRIWIYLPPDYYTSTNNYPVVYMHDGQNLFDYYTSFAGEWGIDESMQEIFSDGDSTSIIVGIDNGGLTRIDEYSPWVNSYYGGGEGDEYAAFIVETLKPFIDGSFRTLPDRNNTAVAGSSLGALISYYTILQYPEVFSKAGLFSPSFWFSNEVLTFTENFSKVYNQKIYIVADDDESDEMVDDIYEIKDALMQSGFAEDELKVVIETNGAHSEWFWKLEFPDAYRWLFDIEASISILEPDQNHIMSYYDFVTQTFYAKHDGAEKLSYTLLDIHGRLLDENLMHSEYITFNSLKPGIYFITIRGSGHSITQKIIII